MGFRRLGDEVGSRDLVRGLGGSVTERRGEVNLRIRILTASIIHCVRCNINDSHFGGGKWYGFYGMYCRSESPALTPVACRYIFWCDR